MYHKLRVRFPWHNQYEDAAIDDINFGYVKPGGSGKSLAYDMDGVLCCEIGMDYDELVARLNGEEVPEKPQPVVVSKWVWVPKDGKCVQACFSQSVAEHTVSRHGGYAVELKGEYTP